MAIWSFFHILAGERTPDTVYMWFYILSNAAMQCIGVIGQTVIIIHEFYGDIMIIVLSRRESLHASS